MKKLTKPLLLFAIGFILMATTQQLTQCIFKDDALISNGINPNELQLDIDMKAINKLGDKIENAFQNADQVALDSITFKESMDVYQSNVTPYTTDELAAIGKAFKKRSLVSASEMYAEFSYKIDGNSYSVTMGRDDKGDWKIIRY